jgi:hypothetical protein
MRIRSLDLCPTASEILRYTVLNLPAALVFMRELCTRTGKRKLCVWAHTVCVLVHSRIRKKLLDRMNRMNRIAGLF